MLRAQESAGEIHVEHALPLVPVEKMGRSTAGDTGRRDNGVDPPVLGGMDAGAGTLEGTTGSLPIDPAATLTSTL